MQPYALLNSHQPLNLPQSSSNSSTEDRIPSSSNARCLEGKFEEEISEDEKKREVQDGVGFDGVDCYDEVVNDKKSDDDWLVDERNVDDGFVKKKGDDGVDEIKYGDGKDEKKDHYDGFDRGGHKKDDNNVFDGVNENKGDDVVIVDDMNGGVAENKGEDVVVVDDIVVDDVDVGDAEKNGVDDVDGGDAGMEGFEGYYENDGGDVGDEKVEKKGDEEAVDSSEIVGDIYQQLKQEHEDEIDSSKATKIAETVKKRIKKDKPTKRYSSRVTPTKRGAKQP
ncbi:hypothetical protein Droror1_Dr00023407 [Drosera rotundifolia]